MNGYNFKTTVLKGLKALGLGAAGVVGAALAGYLSNAPAVTQALHNAGFSDLLVAALVPLITAGGAAALNYLKHSSDGVVQPAEKDDR